MGVFLGGRGAASGQEANSGCYAVVFGCETQKACHKGWSGKHYVVFLQEMRLSAVYLIELTKSAPCPRCFARAS